MLLSQEDSFKRMIMLSLTNVNFQDMDIRDSEIVELVNQIEELEKKLFAHPMHKVCYKLTMNSMVPIL